MNVGKMRKKREWCLLLLWLGHHYLLMSNNINTATAAVSSSKIASFLPTVTGTSCHGIYSIRTSPTNTTEAESQHYYFEKYSEGSSLKEKNSICFKNLIKCSSQPKIIPYNVGQTTADHRETQRACITYKQSDCFPVTDEVQVEKQGHVCLESKSKGNQICGSIRCSLCLNLKKSFIDETVTAVAATTKMENGIRAENSSVENSSDVSAEESVCICPLGYKGPKCDQIERKHFVTEPTDFNSQLDRVLSHYETEDKWIVGLTLMGLISVSSCGVFLILLCCFYIFIKHVFASFTAFANENRRQNAIFSVSDTEEEEISSRCKFSDLKLCCHKSESEFDDEEVEMDDIEEFTYPP